MKAHKQTLLVLAMSLAFASSNGWAGGLRTELQHLRNTRVSDVRVRGHQYRARGTGGRAGIHHHGGSARGGKELAVFGVCQKGQRAGARVLERGDRVHLEGGVAAQFEAEADGQFTESGHPLAAGEP